MLKVILSRLGALLLKLLVYDKEVLFYIIDYLCMCVYMLFFRVQPLCGYFEKKKSWTIYVIEIWVKIAS